MPLLMRVSEPSSDRHTSSSNAARSSDKGLVGGTEVGVASNGSIAARCSVCFVASWLTLPAAF